MVKIKRNKRRKRYQYKNKKRTNNAGSKRVKCLTVDKEWNQRRTTKRNYNELGLAYDLNLISTSKIESEEIKPVTAVVGKLEKDANALRAEKSYRLPKNQVEYLSYLLDTYGDDYKAMTRDKKNYLQLTWKQFRIKVNAFRNIPEQFSKYLELRKSAGLPDLVSSSIDDDADLF